MNTNEKYIFLKSQLFLCYSIVLKFEKITLFNIFNYLASEKSHLYIKKGKTTTNKNMKFNSDNRFFANDSKIITANYLR